jgi:hypothetical protein
MLATWSLGRETCDLIYRFAIRVPRCFIHFRDSRFDFHDAEVRCF